MALFDFLLKTYGYDEPILINRVQFESYSRPWLYKELNKLCKDKSVIRFDKGLYYIPRQTVLGPSVLDPRRVIERKYVESGDAVFGYYSGQFFMNQIGISNQMPNIIEVYTNHESAKVRDITIGSQKVRLRKARTDITKDNAPVLSFLELMNTIDPNIVNEEIREQITRYIVEHNITRNDITRYSCAFPDKAMRAMIESEVVYRVTQ